MKKLLLVIIFGFSIMGLEAGDFQSSGKGGTAVPFLTLGPGARALAMGEAFTAVVEDSTALYWNPAALSTLKNKSFTAMHAAYLESSAFDYGSYSSPLGESSAYGIGVQYFSAGSIEKRDTNGFGNGDFTPNDLALSLGYSRKWNSYSIGMTGKYLRSEILDVAQTGAVDLGLLSPLYQNNLRWGATLTNLGGKIKYDNESENLPLALTLGGRWIMTSRWMSAMDIKFPRSNDPQIGLGTEYSVTKNQDWNWKARGGFNTLTLRDIDGMTGLSFGVGLLGPQFSIDYALLPFGDLGLSHVVSVSFVFKNK